MVMDDRQPEQMNLQHRKGARDERAQIPVGEHAAHAHNFGRP